mmetsp:Transcript_2763/g.8138  ORF Transcript_2763/g.8138 Transcript_2763/m.8138 type:complete len:201 (-) Transcript_2763:262-864(-)
MRCTPADADAFSSRPAPIRLDAASATKRVPDTAHLATSTRPRVSQITSSVCRADWARGARRTRSDAKRRAPSSATPASIDVNTSDARTHQHARVADAASQGARTSRTPSDTSANMSARTQAQQRAQTRAATRTSPSSLGRSITSGQTAPRGSSSSATDTKSNWPPTAYMAAATASEAAWRPAPRRNMGKTTVRVNCCAVP